MDTNFNLFVILDEIALYVSLPCIFSSGNSFIGRKCLMINLASGKCEACRAGEPTLTDA